jgi:hypothetical protein
MWSVREFLNVELMQIWVDENKGRMKFGRVTINYDDRVSLEYRRLTPKEEKSKILKIYKTIYALSFGGRSNILEYKSLVDEIIDRGDYSYFQQCLLINFNIDIINYASINEIKNGTWEQICFQTLTPIQERLNKLYKSKLVFQNGYDIYSDDPNYISMTFSGPLSSTYSVIGSVQPEINFNQSASFVYLNNPNIFNIEFKRVRWEIIDGVRIPFELYEHYSILSGTHSYFTQSSYRTTIPRDHGADYLVSTTSRDPYINHNYILTIFKDNYIGKIEEFDSFENNPLYYYRSSEVAKVLGFKRTFLKVTKKDNLQPVIFDNINETISEDMNLYNRYISAINYILS